MAIKTIQVITDDIDGNELPQDTKPIALSLGGKAVELHLSEENRTKLADLLEPYFALGTPVSRATRRPREASGGASPKAVRAWAVAQGYDVPSRGRLPKEIVDRYESANA